MIHGLSEEQQKLLFDTVITPLKQKNCEVWVFGSRARGDYQKFSDIDLLFSPPKKQKLPPGFLFEIKSEAEESNLIYKLDLVNIHELADSYRESVMKDRVLL